MGEKAINYVSQSTESTERFGALLARTLRPGDIVLLDGDLGSGKTVMTRGIAKGLGIEPNVVSPTYMLVIEYPAEEAGTDLFHFDVYRLDHANQFLQSGLDEYFDRGGVCVIEWGERIRDALPKDPICVFISGNGAERHIRISFPENDGERQNYFFHLLFDPAEHRRS